MEPLLPEWNVIMLGAWNRQVLTPDWIAREVIKKEEGVAAEMTLLVDGSDTLQVKFIEQGFTMRLQPGRLVLAPNAASRKDTKRACEAAEGILRLLRHTPVTAVGINLAYQTNSPTEKLAGMIDAARWDEILDPPIETSTVRVSAITVGDQPTNLMMRISLDHKSGSMTARFNYHCPCKNSEQAAERIRGLADRVEDHAIELLGKIPVGEITPL